MVAIERNRAELWSAQFPWPREDGHKYDRGHAALLSGPAGRTGAIRLAARGALRIGAGLVTVLCSEDAMAEHAAQLDAVMLRSARDARGLLQIVLEDARFSALCLGPGFGQEWAKRVVPELLTLGRAAVLDADALHALPKAQLGTGEAPIVLTPHEGEFAAAFSDISLDHRASAASNAANRTGAIVVLKGPKTIIAAPDGRVVENGSASPFLATAGSGDVLAGFVTGLLAQGMPGFEAACAAVALHTECADRVGPGLISEDLPDLLPQVLRTLYESRS